MTTVLESLNTALHEAFAEDERVYLIGEDLLDPYGGAFKVSRGLSTVYPDRVLTSPISEAAITGLAAGMAMRGLRPVVEIMFGDFITLAADQIINHIAKFHWMYNEQVQLPLVIRTPMGGRRGYGPTHSQTLEKLFLGVPGLNIIAPTSVAGEQSTDDGPGGLLKRSILNSKGPVLFIENKLLYLQTILTPIPGAEFEIKAVNISRNGLETPAYGVSIAGAPEPTLTLATYGFMAELALEAQLKLAYQHEIFTELIVLTRLTPFDLGPIFDSTQKTGKLLTIEEGTYTMGWGAEVLARTVQSLGTRLKAAGRAAAIDLPIPASTELERAVLPGVDSIVQQALRLAKQKPL